MKSCLLIAFCLVMLIAEAVTGVHLMGVALGWWPLVHDAIPSAAGFLLGDILFAARRTAKALR